MIVVHIIGGLGNQISQYAFGLLCAQRLGVSLKLDTSAYQTYTLHSYGLDKFALSAEVATEEEIASAKQVGVVTEGAILLDPSVFDEVRDGVYLHGYWADYRYNEPTISSLRHDFQPCRPLSLRNQALADDISRFNSVSLHIRRGDYVTNPNCVLMPLTYYEDSLREIGHCVQQPHVYIFSDDMDWVAANLEIELPHTFVHGNDAAHNVDDFELMRKCKHHIIANSTFSYWAARLSQSSGVTIAPQQYFRPGDPYLIQMFRRIHQLVWPREWIVMPIRMPNLTALRPSADIVGPDLSNNPVRIGVWNYYESLTTDGFIFKNTNAAVGHDLLKPWCDLYLYGQVHGFDFVTLDQVSDPSALDAVIFLDRPQPGNPIIENLLQSNVIKYLYIYETAVIKPNNWEISYHKLFDRIFTWSDEHANSHRYIKQNFSIDPSSPYDFEVLKTAFHQRKLCTLIAGAKGSAHPNELYSERIRTIQWFQQNRPEEFDLYGFGWSQDLFPSYRGSVINKLATLARYRFAICYENAGGFPGYVTEKMLDCFRAGVIPVYLGPPNIADLIPNDCFISRLDFIDNESMFNFIHEMDIGTYEAYLDRIKELMVSPVFYPFTIEHFIRNVTSTIFTDINQKRSADKLTHDTCVAACASNYRLSGDIDILEIINLADRLIRTGKHPEAIEVYQDWIHNSVSNMRHVAAFNLGAIWENMGQLGHAQESYELSLALEPRFSLAFDALTQVKDAYQITKAI